MCLLKFCSRAERQGRGSPWFRKRSFPSFVKFSGMVEVMTEGQITDAFEMASSDLKFLFDKEGVDRLTQARLYSAGVATVKQLAVLCKDADELRSSAKDFLDIDPSKGLREKAKLTKVLVAFETAKVRAFKAAEMDGDAAVKEVPKALPSTDFHGMRDAFERTFWVLEDKRVPSRSYMERRLENMEKNDLRIEPLSEVTNIKEDEESDVFRTMWDASGNLSAVKKRAKVELPQDPEALRARITLLGTSWIFAGLQHSNRDYLRDVHPQMFQDYLDYLLGETCMASLRRVFGASLVGAHLGRSS